MKPASRLLAPEAVIGVFRGARGGGLEFHAQVTLACFDGVDGVPIHGRFVLIELADPDEAVLGRVASVTVDGWLTGNAGEERALRMAASGSGMSSELRAGDVRYRMDVRLLGVVRRRGDELLFAPSHRRVPQVGAPVGFLPDEVLRSVAGGTRGAQIGFYALGEFVYCGNRSPHAQSGQAEGDAPAWVRPMEPAVPVRFATEQLVARRSFVFARAGFGKSNLVKLLFSGLYAQHPRIAMADGGETPVGTVVFDPDGEYFWPGTQNLPALCDVPELADQLAVFTNQEPPSPYYGSFKVEGVHVDIRHLVPALVISVALTPEQQLQQNVHKLRALSGEAWRELVDLIHRDGNNASEVEVARLVGLNEGQDAELYAARAHMTRIVRELHDPSSRMLALLLGALQEGKLCIVDISRMRGAAGLALSGIVLRYIFERNQREFTRAHPKPIPTIAVIEEAQSVLGRYGSGESAYEEWVKEGRKYGLGAMLITQQPGSIPHELLSQGDSWFIFHLLSEGDLRAVKAANSHFSDDLLSSLLNEPLPGNGVFWSSASGDPGKAGNAYPIPLRVLSFDELHSVRDPRRCGEAVEVYARRLAQGLPHAPAVLAGKRMEGTAGERVDGTPWRPRATDDDFDGRVRTDGDLDAQLRAAVVERLRSDREFNQWLERGNAIPWEGVRKAIERGLPPNCVPDPERWAGALVKGAMVQLYGAENEGWRIESRPRKNDPKHTVKWVVIEPS